MCDHSHVELFLPRGYVVFCALGTNPLYVRQGNPCFVCRGFPNIESSMYEEINVQIGVPVCTLPLVQNLWQYIWKVSLLVDSVLS